jgi:predicted SAM-dependent methyltransferase
MKDICLNLGCGSLIIKPNALEEWYNFDNAEDVCSTHPNDIIRHDLKLGLPQFIKHPDTVTFINMTQFLEHLNLPHVIELLKECYTVLIKNKGRIRISVPDAGLLYDRYLDDRMDDFYDVQPPIYREFDNPMIRLALMLFGSLDKDGSSGHKMMYTHGSLKYLLEKCGFKDVVYEAFNDQYDAPIARNHQLCLEARA